MIEKLLTDLTAALAETTQAINRLTGLADLAANADEPKPAAPAKKKAATKKKAAKPEPADLDEDDVLLGSDEDDNEGVPATMDDVLALAKELLSNDRRAEVQAALTKCGITQVRRAADDDAVLQKLAIELRLIK